MTTQLKERPVVFTTEEVNAVLAGNKTQHRLVVGNPSNGFEFDFNLSGLTTPAIGHMDNKFGLLTKREIHPNSNKFERGVEPCPFGKVGDRFIAKEPYYGSFNNEHIATHSRSILLEITDIRIERVQDTSHADAVAEGVHHFDIEARLRDQPLSAAQIVFSRYWDTRHQDGFENWESNPWVWVIEFKKVDE